MKTFAALSALLAVLPFVSAQGKQHSKCKVIIPRSNMFLSGAAWSQCGGIGWTGGRLTISILWRRFESSQSQPQPASAARPALSSMIVRCQCSSNLSSLLMTLPDYSQCIPGGTATTTGSTPSTTSSGPAPSSSTLPFLGGVNLAGWVFNAFH
jgi:hypothetical protein